jgi:hypothetical protein
METTALQYSSSAAFNLGSLTDALRAMANALNLVCVICRDMFVWFSISSRCRLATAGSCCAEETNSKNLFVALAYMISASVASNRHSTSGLINAARQKRPSGAGIFPSILGLWNIVT